MHLFRRNPRPRHGVPPLPWLVALLCITAVALSVWYVTGIYTEYGERAREDILHQSDMIAALLSSLEGDRGVQLDILHSQHPDLLSIAVLARDARPAPPLLVSGPDIWSDRTLPEDGYRADGTRTAIAVVPLRSPDGSGEQLLGIQFSLDLWRAEQWRHVRHGIVNVTGLLLMLTAVVLVIRWNRRMHHMSRRIRRDEALMRTVFDQAPVGLAVMRRDQHLSLINPGYEKILGRSGEELRQMTWQELTHPDDLEQDRQEFERFDRGETDGYSMEKRFLRPDGTGIWVHMIIARLYVGDSPTGDHLCILRDIQQRREAEESLRESDRSRRMLLSNLPGLAYRCRYDRHWTMEFLSDGCLQLTGYRPEQLLYNGDISYNDVILPAYRTSVRRYWDAALQQREPFQYEYEIRTADGQTRWVLEVGRGVYDTSGAVTALEGIIVDIDERKQREQRVLYLSEHDDLTGLHNRQYYERQKERMDAIAPLPLSVLICDINGVRLINDAFGHQEGDRIIHRAAEVLASCRREKDLLARTGGDEFTLLMPYTGRSQAYQRMQEIQEACDRVNRSVSDRDLHLNLSVGYGTREQKTDTLADAEQEAEMYLNRRKLLEHRSYHSTLLSSITATMFARSQETKEHGERLAELCDRVGARLGLDQVQLDELQLLAMLHDIGKIGIDDQILNKPGPLTEGEWEIMKTHPEIGYRIAMSSQELHTIADLILAHHERWDGTGYPQGLSGDQIPLAARIIALADAYDAMTEDRVYRKAMTPKEAVEEIRRNAGTQFDPGVAAVFIEVVTETDPRLGRRT